MNLKSHIYFADIVGDLLEQNGVNLNRRILKYGSVFPDVYLPMRLEKHYYEVVKRNYYDILDNLLKKTDYFNEDNGFSVGSSLNIGILMHYLCDFFTYPHTHHYSDTFKQHIHYEKEIYLLLNNTDKYKFLNQPEGWDFYNGSIYDLKPFLENLMNRYMNENFCPENDILFTRKASFAFVSCIVSVKKRQNFSDREFLYNQA